MLLELRIENMALVDRLQLDLTGSDCGLVVFTGETGAGKSIILQAIHLLAGERGASSWIRNRSSAAAPPCSSRSTTATATPAANRPTPTC